MNKQELDVSKLLGFRLSPLAETEAKFSVKLGQKAGLKAGDKSAKATTD